MSLKDHTPEFQLNVAWTELLSAVNARDPKRCMSLLFWIKSLLKKTTILTAIIAFLFVGVGMIHPVFAQVSSISSPDAMSSVTAGGSGMSISDGVNYYQDSLTVSCDGSSGGSCSALISTSTPFTILSITVNSGFGLTHGYVDDLKCGTVSIGDVHMIQNVYNNLVSAGAYASFGNSPVVSQTNYPIHCSSNLTTSGYSSYYFIQYVPYDTRLVSPSSATLSDLSLALAIIIVILFLMVVGMFYNNISRKKPWL